MSEVVAEVVEVEMTEERLRNIVQLRVANVPDWQIAEGFGLSGDLLQQLVETDEYKAMFAAYFQKQITDTQIANEGWDGVELTALKSLRESMEYMSDPQFSLKVAAVANKAARRPIIGVKPIEAGDGGTAVIYINNNFVHKMQTMNITTRDHLNDGGEKKQHDFVDPNKVENILLGEDYNKNEELDMNELLGENLQLVRDARK